MRQLTRAQQWAAAAAVTALTMGGAPAPGGCAELDLETSFATAPTTAEPGQVVTYSVDYTNHGGSAASNGRLRLLLPSGLFLSWTPAEIANVEGSFTDDQGNDNVDVGLDTNTCDNMLVSVAGAGGVPELSAGTTGRFSIAIPLPAAIPTVGMLVVHSPQEVAGIYSFVRGACSSCADPASCFGGPLSTKAPVTADLELVVDPTPGAGQTASMGCHVPQGFTTGRIALVRRGSCAFGLKALNAQQAGATGVVIVDDEAHEGEDLYSMVMDGGDETSQVTIPVVMVGYAQGEALIAQVEAAVRVIATLGGVQSEDLPFTAVAYHAPGSPDSDPDGLNDFATAITHVGYLADQAPAAAFSFSPTTPVKGQEVHFVDASANEPATWSWDFGDGTVPSDAQNPVHSYGEPGIYHVTLTASNDFGSDSVTHDVSVAGVIQGRHDHFVAAAANAEGDMGAFFVTDLEVNNDGATPLLFQLAWLPRGEDNSSPTTSDAFMLAPGRGVRYTNVLDGMFGLSDALGAVAVLTDGDGVLIMSRTYTLSAGETPATFGQSLPGVALEEMITTGSRRRILFMTENADYRSNVGCQNGVPREISVTVARYAADGTSLGSQAMSLPPWSNKQISRVFRNEAPLADGYVDVWSDTPDASFFCYGSVVDNHTNDPTTVLPQ